MDGNENMSEEMTNTAATVFRYFTFDWFACERHCTSSQRKSGVLFITGLLVSIIPKEEVSVQSKLVCLSYLTFNQIIWVSDYEYSGSV